MRVFFCRLRLVGLVAVCLMELALGVDSLAGQQVPTTKAPTGTLTAKELADPLRTDWPNLKHFHEEDVALPAAAADEKRVVFMGDSITQGWSRYGVPPEKPVAGVVWVNRGISGQTTPQMVLRFQQDVIHLKPNVVVIFAGTNDVAGNTGDMTPEQTEDNLTSMAELAHANGIQVVLCSILPAFDFPWKPGREPSPKIIALNRWIKGYAAEHEYVYVDFYSAMVDARGGLPANLSIDGVHPTPAGYAVMNPLIEAGVAKALAGK
jgi:lysophospholipase L1-like esterase